MLQYLRTLVEKETSLGLVLNGVGRTVENMDLGIFRLQSLSILIIRIKYFCSQNKVINPPPLPLNGRSKLGVCEKKVMVE